MKTELARYLESALDSAEGAPWKSEDFDKALESLKVALLTRGRLTLGSDHTVGGRYLEIRVKCLFEEMGFHIREGRKGGNLEDYVIDASADFNTQLPVALEIKSGKKPCLERGDLRQLDDWVFELSGEDRIRRFRPTRGRNVVYITAGLPVGPSSHPTPHKGVLVFNGPLGVKFHERLAACVNENDLEFVEKRYFCIIPFQTLIEMAQHIEEETLTRSDAWEMIHCCSGILQFPG